ncbi:MAG TPA: hypothetical protein VE988_30420 [Gemmataceae bacterium]|nr:hypothetical protein [Gemmataceae bacterium]
MHKMLATFRNGHVELDQIANWPDGTRLEVGPTNHKLGLDESEWPQTPEEKTAWLEWLNALEPLELTPAELAAFDEALQASKDVQKELLRQIWRREERA